MKRLILTVMLVFLISSTAGAASEAYMKTTAVALNEACMETTADNQAKVETFVMNVMADAKNRTLPTPIFFQGLCKNDIAIKECRTIIEKVVKMADAGLVDKIEMPIFKYDGSE